MLKRRSAERGHTILELSVVIPVAIGLGLAALDIAQGLNGYLAIREGARTALRCVYTSDGLPGCNIAEASDREPMYSATVREVSAGYPFDINQVAGTEYFLQAPRYSFNGFEGRRLTEIQYTTQSFAYSADRVTVVAEGDTPEYSLMVGRSPYVQWGGTQPGSAQFVWKNNRSQSYPGITVGWNGSGVVERTSSGVELINLGYSDLFRINRPVNFPADRECWNSHRLDHPNGEHDPSGDACSEEDQDPSDGTINVVLHIRGSANGTQSNGEGVVKALLEECNLAGGQCREVYDLGGRHFSSSSNDASLVPRGLPRGDAVPQSGGKNPGPYNDAEPGSASWPELLSYSDIKVRFNKKYRVRFTLEALPQSGLNREVHYEGQGIDVYRVRFQTEEAETRACDTPFAPTEIPDTCSADSGVALSDVRERSPRQIASATPTEFGFRSSENLPLSSFVPPNQVPNYEGFNSVSHNYGPITKSCPENFGVSSSPSGDTLHNDPQALSLCNFSPVTGPGLPSPSEQVLSSYQHSMPFENLGHTAQWTEDDCQSLGMPDSEYPTSYFSYAHKRMVGEPILQEMVPMYLGASVDPREATNPGSPATDVRYNCGQFPVQSKAHPDADTYQALDPEIDYYRMNHLGPICEHELQTEAVAQAREELPVHAASFFEAEAHLVGTGSGSIEQAVGCDGTVSAPSTNGNVINEYTISPLTYSETQDLSVCLLPNTVCQFEFLGFEGGSDSEQPIGHDFDTAAEAYGFQEIRAMNPRAQWNCSGKDCVRLTVDSNGEHLRADAEIDVNLFLLGGNPFTLRYSESERWEGHLSR